MKACASNPIFARPASSPSVSAETLTAMMAAAQLPDEPDPLVRLIRAHGDLVDRVRDERSNATRHLL
jgi:2-oxo-4-hydroxy-4-carboxy--5-ureidoimidazoline (OHCU) decarboxylase